MSLDEAVAGTKAPAEVVEQLELIDVPFVDFDGTAQTGQLVVNRALAAEIKDIFAAIAKLKFPIEKIVPAVKYDWVDERTMADNNTSAFNYRLISGTNTPSLHGLGRAIDINPRINPYFGRLGVEPAGAVYDTGARGALVDGHPVVKLFLDRGWTWLGHRPEFPDYQHFQKEA
jgi:hypothetical protein